jgi:tetratricopeptide (TPR) repeat protein
MLSLGDDWKEASGGKVFLGVALCSTYAQELMAVGKLDECEKELGQLKQIIEERSEPSAIGLEIDLLHAYGNLSEVRRDWPEAIENWSRSLELARTSEDRPKIADNLFQIGNARLELHELEASVDNFREALIVYDELGLGLRVAHVQHQLGILREEQGLLEEAYRNYSEAAGTFQACGFTMQASLSLHQLGIIATRLRRLDDAESIFQHCIQIRLNGAMVRQLPTDYFHMGLISLLRSDFAKAEEWTRKSIDLATKGQFHDQLGTYFHQLGLIQADVGDLESARVSHSTALREYAQVGMSWDVADELAQLAILSEELNDTASARDFDYRARALLKDQGREVPTDLRELSRTSNLSGANK